MLDLGAGNGRDTVFLLSQGFRVRYVDISAEAVDHTREQLRAGGLASDRVSVECGDVLSVDERDGGVHGAVLIGVVNSLTRQAAQELFARLRRWMAPGGIVMITVPLTPQAEPTDDEPEFDYTYAPGSLPDDFPGWRIHLHEEKRGKAFWVCLFVAEKPKEHDAEALEQGGIRAHQQRTG